MRKIKKITTEEKLEILDKAIELMRSGVPAGDAWQQVTAGHGVSVRTVEHWYKAVREHPRPKWPILLQPKHKGRVVSAPFSEEAWGYFLAEYEKTMPPSFKKAYDKTRGVAAKNHWDLPALRTVQRRFEKQGKKKRSIVDDIEAFWVFFWEHYQALDRKVFAEAYECALRDAEDNDIMVPSKTAVRKYMVRQNPAFKQMWDDN